MPDDFENASQSLLSIFLANIFRRLINNSPAPTRINRNFLYRVIGMKDDNDSDNQFSNLDDDNGSNFVYYNLEDKARFD